MIFVKKFIKYYAADFMFIPYSTFSRVLYGSKISSEGDPQKYEYGEQNIIWSSKFFTGDFFVTF